MIKQILLPIDASEHSNTAFQFAASLAKKLKAKINILHVVDMKILAGNFLADFGALTGAAPFFNFKKNISSLLEEKSKTLIKIYSEKCRSLKLPFNAESSEGIVSKKIAQTALLNDLVVLGQFGENATHSHGLLGSVSENVTRNSKKPVLLTPQKYRGIKKILLAYDGSDSAKSALEITSELASALKLKVDVMTVEESRTGASRIIKECTKYLAAYRIKPAIHISSGTPAEITVSYTHLTLPTKRIV